MNGLDIIFGKYTFETYLLKNTDFSNYFIYLFSNFHFLFRNIWGLLREELIYLRLAPNS